MVRALGVDKVVQPGDLLLKNLAVEKEERAERLVLRRCRDASLDGQGRQETCDLCRPHVRGMALAVKEDVAANPRDIRLLGATAIVPGSNRIAHTIEKPRFGRTGRTGLTERKQRCPSRLRRRQIRTRSARPMGDHDQCSLSASRSTITRVLATGNAALADRIRYSRPTRTRLSALLRLNSPIVKGYLLKEDLRRFWDYRSTAWAEAHLRAVALAGSP